MALTIAQALLPSFLIPGLAVAGAAAVAVPVIIHILSRRPRKPEAWAAMRFLLNAYRKHRVRTRLEQWLLLAVRCLILLLLGVALAGPIWSAAASLAGLGGGRTFVVVLDDSVTSGATEGVGRQRFQALKDAADKLLASLQPGDRVALITASRPAGAVVSEPTTDPMVVRNQVRELQPTVAAADLPEALRLAKQSLEAGEAAEGRSYVVLLSDFSLGSTRLQSGGGEAGLPSELGDLGSLATLLRNDPLPTARNVQITAMEPDRRVVLGQTAGQPSTVMWTLRLRRFDAGELEAGLSTVRLTLPGSQPVRQPVEWSIGQAEAEVRIATPVSENGLVTAEATLEPEREGTDALIADNTVRALVSVRQKLTVMLVGDEEVEGSPLTPRRWLTTVLAPVSDRLGWPVEVREVEGASIGAGAVEMSEADAVIVLRPDQLDEAGFAAIRQWTEAGGLAWFVAPSGSYPPLWTQELPSAFALPWSIGQSPVTYETPISLDTDGPVAGELRRLSAELTDLLRPIEVDRRLPVDPASLGSGTDVLLAGSGGEPLLIGADTPRGGGRVLLLAVAVDPAWSNLPTKPLVVPLMHEVLRAAIDRLQPVQAFEPGDQPVLGAAWDNATKLTGPDGQAVLLVNAERGTRNEEQGSNGVQPIRPLALAGVYRGDTEALVVNVNGDAADTRATDGDALRSYLAAAGDWRRLDTANPAATLRIAGDRADLGWPLLWVVLALALIETFLARAVSHASGIERTVSVVELNARKAA